MVPCSVFLYLHEYLSYYRSGTTVALGSAKISMGEPNTELSPWSPAKHTKMKTGQLSITRLNMFVPSECLGVFRQKTVKVQDPQFQ